MDKLLALIFEWGKAPQSLKDAAAAHRQSSNKYLANEAKIAQFQKENAELKATYIKNKQTFENELNNWNPAAATT